MKIAILTKYGNLVASTRQRFLQYQPFINEAGFEIEFHSLFDDEYLASVYETGSHRPAHITWQYLKRIQWLISSPKIDAIWLQYEVFPYLPGFAEILVRWPGKPVILDYDDAIFHNYDLHPKYLVRKLLGHKLHNTMGSANVVLCGNPYLAEYAQDFCSNVAIIPTVLDTSTYRPASFNRCKNIGWIGTPSTWVEYMQDLLPTLTQIIEENAPNFRIAVMGADKQAAFHPLVEFFGWSEKHEIQFLQNIEIGVMPLKDTSWARGKCGYKLIQYMACGVPVIASPIGINKDLVEHGVNGYLVETDEEWSEAIRKLISNEDLRREMGKAGRKKIESSYSLHVWGPKVAELLKQTVICEK